MDKENLVCVYGYIYIHIYTYIYIYTHTHTHIYSQPSLIAQSVNLPAMQETQVQFLGWEDPLEKEMATQVQYSLWRVPQTEKPGRLQSMGSQESDTAFSDKTTILSHNNEQKCHLQQHERTKTPKNKPHMMLLICGI